MSANSADAKHQLEIVLVKAGRTKIRYPAQLLADDGTRVTVRAPWAGDGVRDFGFVRFEPGDVFTEYYWRDRWYAVKEDPRELHQMRDRSLACGPELREVYRLAT